MELEKIGFYTLSDKRAKIASINSLMMRCELLLTDKCNFRCPYCRGVMTKYRGDIELQQAKKIIGLWSDGGLQNIRFTGGEPTLYPHIIDVVKYAKQRNIKRIAISTNGSADFSLYKTLFDSGVNDFSISFDACCSTTCNKMSGTKDMYKKILHNAEKLARITYVTAGVVLTEHNQKELPETIKICKQIGMSDIRIIPAAQRGNEINIDDVKVNAKFPILQYRLNNIKNGRNIRGITLDDYHSCPLVLDDSFIAGNYHFPCVIHFREKGNPVGRVGKNMRQERYQWFKTHNTFTDKICQKNCLDVCVDYNNRWAKFQTKICIPKMQPELFDWSLWRSESVADIIPASRYELFSLYKNRLRKYAIGYCEGKELICRPKENQFAVMFDKNNTFWFHMFKSEFYNVFSDKPSGGD